MCSVEGCSLVALRGLGPSLDVHGEESDKSFRRLLVWSWLAEAVFVGSRRTCLPVGCGAPARGCSASLVNTRTNRMAAVTSVARDFESLASLPHRLPLPTPPPSPKQHFSVGFSWSVA